MVEVLFFIGIIAYIIKAAKKADENQKRHERANASNNPWETLSPQTPKAIRADSPRMQVQQQNNRWEKEAQRAQKNKTPPIVARAKANADENKADITLESMEAEHNHSERVSVAEHHHVEDILPENMLGTIEDLMVKGYEGNLCFDRDFVGEGLDMISRFTVPSDVPDFS